MSIQTHWHYGIYGHRLCSNLPLLGSAHQSFSKRDIAFCCSHPEASSDPLCGDARLLTRGSTDFGCYLGLYETDRGFLLRWEERCDFLVSWDGRGIQCTPASSTDLNWVRNILYTVVLSFALHVRSVSNFHASAVVLPEGAVGFLAEPGSGKSTLAATFAAAGYPLLTDDVLVLKEGHQGVKAYPGFPCVSLSSESMDNVFGPARGPSRISTNGEKQRLDVEEQGMPFCRGSASLKRLYLLDHGDINCGISIDPLPRVESMTALLTHTHCLSLLPVSILRGHLAFTARLVSSVPVYRLSYPLGWDHVPDIISYLLDNQRDSACTAGYRSET